MEQAGPRDSSAASSSSHGDLRQQAASHMQQHPDDYLPFVVQVSTILTPLEAVCTPHEHGGPRSAMQHRNLVQLWYWQKH